MHFPHKNETKIVKITHIVLMVGVMMETIMKHVGGMEEIVVGIMLIHISVQIVNVLTQML